MDLCRLFGELLIYHYIQHFFLLYFYNYYWSLINNIFKSLIYFEK